MILGLEAAGIIEEIAEQCDNKKFIVNQLFTNK
jgi:hypothetical protein